MKKWVVKAVVQKIISYLPFSRKINYFFQKYITKGVFLDEEYFLDRLGHAKTHLYFYHKYTNISLPNTTLELGTGWYPVVPVAFFLSGVNKIYSVDINFLTSKNRILITIKKFIESHNSGVLQQYLKVIPQKMQVLQSICDSEQNISTQEILDILNIVYHIEDARNLSFPNDTIDLINSNNTFEHIYPKILEPILVEMKRVVKKSKGVMSHSIDMSDHFAHFDRTITMYNFLQFSSKQWAWIDNSLMSQSRLRIYDYKKMYNQLNIFINEETFRSGNMIELNSIKLNKDYSIMPKNEVAITHCHFVSVFNK